MTESEKQDVPITLNEAPRIGALLFWAVVCSTVGLFAAVSLWRMTRSSAVPNLMSSGRLVALVCTEAVMALAWLPYLRRRGWRVSSVTLPASLRDLAAGASLFVLALLAYWLTWFAGALLAPDFVRLAAGVEFTGRPAWWAAALTAIVNPVAEEFLYLGFIARVFKGESAWLALTASVVARVFVHLYQGPLAFLSILPIGVVFGAYYLRTNRIWPVIIAHAAMDLWALAHLASAS